MRQFRSYHDVRGAGNHPIEEQVGAQRARLAERLARIHHVVPTVSGKGGVGKSAITANLAVALARRGLRVGAVDADLNGPSLARMLGVAPSTMKVTTDGIQPHHGVASVRVVSMDLLLDTPDAPLRWRGPASDEHLWRGALEVASLREFIADVAWGDLDFLLIDTPPGTDRIQRLLELVPDPDVVLLVTSPSGATSRVVSRSERLLVEAGVKRIARVTNMTHCTCPGCGEVIRLFESGDLRPGSGAVEPWADIPFDPAFTRSTDEGQPPLLRDTPSPVKFAFERLADRLIEECGS